MTVGSGGAWSKPGAAGAHCHVCPNREAPLVSPRPATRHHRLTVIGDVPTRKDEERREVFTPNSAVGIALDRALGLAGVVRRDVHLTLAALCRSDKDRDNEKAVKCCAPRLLHEVGRAPATEIVTLGPLATGSVLGFDAIQLARGFVWHAPSVDSNQVRSLRRRAVREKLSSEARQKAALVADTLEGRALLAGRMVLPSLELGFTTRAETWRPLLDLDMRRVGRVLRNELRADAAAPYSIALNGTSLSCLGPVITLDVETDGDEDKNLEDHKLLCVGMSDGERTIIIAPWAPRWASVLAAFLATRERVVCHNGQYDIAVLEHHGVSG